MTLFYLLLSALIGYLLGSIPFGLIFVKLFKGIDVRDVGSGRTGGTNSYRAGGLPAGMLTAFFDGAKGWVSVWVVGELLAEGLWSDWLIWGQVIAGIFSVFGHNWSVYIKFKGGAGTGPNVGWATHIWVWMAPLSILVALGIFWLNGMASVVSISMALIIPIVFAIRYLLGIDGTWAYTVGGFITLGLVLWSLRPNIKRIIAGTERVVGPRAKKK